MPNKTINVSQSKTLWWGKTHSHQRAAFHRAVVFVQIRPSLEKPQLNIYSEIHEVLEGSISQKTRQFLPFFSWQFLFWNAAAWPRTREGLLCFFTHSPSVSVLSVRHHSTCLNMHPYPATHQPSLTTHTYTSKHCTHCIATRSRLFWFTSLKLIARRIFMLVVYDNWPMHFCKTLCWKSLHECMQCKGKRILGLHIKRNQISWVSCSYIHHLALKPAFITIILIILFGVSRPTKKTNSFLWAKRQLLPNRAHYWIASHYTILFSFWKDSQSHCRGGFIAGVSERREQSSYVISFCKLTNSLSLR